MNINIIRYKRARARLCRLLPKGRKNQANLTNIRFIRVIRVQNKKQERKQEMKKEYINPEMEVVKINTMTLLAGSDPNVNIDTSSDSSIDAGSVEASQWFDNGGSEDW